MTVKIGLERIDIQEGIMVEELLDNKAMRLVMSSEFTKSRVLNYKIERPIYIRNMDGFFNKERPIEYIVEINIYYQEHSKRAEIDVIRG